MEIFMSNIVFALKKTALGVLLAGLAVQASAETINFNEVGSSFQGADPFTSGSLTFSSTSGILGVWTSAPSIGAYNGTPYLLDGFSGTMTFSRSDLQAFTLSSFEIALGWYQPVSNTSMTVTYNLDGGGTIVDSLALTLDYQTFTPGLLVDSVSFDISAVPSGYISLDNININIDGGGQVPEPASLALLSVGLVGLGVMRLRNKTV
jgi:hypothetical protein